MVLKMKDILKMMGGVSLTLMLGFTSYAQKGDIVFAEKQYSLENFRQAAVEYSRVYELSNDYSWAKRVAQSYDRIYEFSLSVEWWKKTVSYDQASREDYLGYLQSVRRSDSSADLGDLLSGSAYSLSDFPELGVNAFIVDVPYRVYELQSLSALNSTGSDYGLFESKDGFRLFSSNRGDLIDQKKKVLRFDAKGSVMKKGGYHSDQRKYYGLYCQNNNGEVSAVIVEGFELFHLTDPVLMEDGQTVFFAATPNRRKRRDAVIHPGIYMGTFDRESNSIREVQPFELNKTDQYGVMNPVLDESARRLYFASNIEGGQGGYDLYYTQFDDRWSFEAPVNLGKLINTKGNERDVFFADGYLYFSSDGHGGIGGLDVFRVKLDATSSGQVENLGSPVNTVSDDFGFSLVGDRQALLTSDRVGGVGYDDFYQVNWSDRNLKFRAMEGLKVETMDGKVIGLEELTQELYQYGEVEVILSYPGYFREKRKLQLNEGAEEIVLDLTPIPVGLEVYEAIIYYDFDKSNLREVSVEKLNEIASLMGRHPELHLVIESHTDSRASEDYNQKLSERRSRAVTQFLEGLGIDKNRVKASWYSELKLVNDCVDGIPCNQQQHQLNRRSELRLIAYPDAAEKSVEFPKGASMEDFKITERAKAWFLNQMGISR
jgi:outer membrane protein OmpA-like peptidoglycan-associated protein